jgi:hypothetical protein
VVHVLVLVRLALLVDRDQQDVRLFGGQHHMTDVPVDGGVRFTRLRERRSLLKAFRKSLFLCCDYLLALRT